MAAGLGLTRRPGLPGHRPVPLPGARRHHAIDRDPGQPSCLPGWHLLERPRARPGLPLAAAPPPVPKILNDRESYDLSEQQPRPRNLRLSITTVIMATTLPEADHRIVHGSGKSSSHSPHRDRGTGWSQNITRRMGKHIKAGGISLIH